MSLGRWAALGTHALKKGGKKRGGLVTVFLRSQTCEGCSEVVLDQEYKVVYIQVFCLLQPSFMYFPWLNGASLHHTQVLMSLWIAAVSFVSYIYLPVSVKITFIGNDKATESKE